MLEYARGNVASLMPFAWADTLFSTLDFRELRTQVAVSTKLMCKELLVRLRERRLGQPFIPNLGAIGFRERPVRRSPKRPKGRSLAN
jgi:hypothetical protein